MCIDVEPACDYKKDYKENHTQYIHANSFKEGLRFVLIVKKLGATDSIQYQRHKGLNLS